MLEPKFAIYTPYDSTKLGIVVLVMVMVLLRIEVNVSVLGGYCAVPLSEEGDNILGPNFSNWIKGRNSTNMI